MKKRPLVFGLVLVIGVLVYWLFPVSWLATPRWEVVVVDERGKPVEDMTVRETWQNYSVVSGFARGKFRFNASSCCW